MTECPTPRRARYASEADAPSKAVPCACGGWHLAPRRPRGNGALYKRADGLWTATVDLPTTDGKRRRKTVSSKDYNTVVKDLRELRKKVADGQIATTGTTTVAKWLAHWLETIQRPHVRPTTYRYYELAVRAYINPHIGGKRLDRLTPEDVRRMHRAVQEDSHRNAQKAHQVLQRALKDAEGEGLVARNVAAAVRKPKHTPAEKGALSIEVAAHILRTAEASRDALASRWVVAFWTGARQGELLGLTWDRVDLTAGAIELSWQLQQLQKVHGCGEPTDGGYPCGRNSRAAYCPEAKWGSPPGFEFRECHNSLVWTRPKSRAGHRIVPLLAPVVAILDAHKTATNHDNPHQLVWHHDGQPYSPTDDANAWKRLLARAKVDHVGIHTIRHSTATILQAAGADSETRERLMGHSSAASQRAYIHVDQAQVRDMLKALDPLNPVTKDSGSR